MRLVKRVLHSLVSRSGIIFDTRATLERRIFEETASPQNLNRIKIFMELINSSLSKFQSDSKNYKRFGSKNDGGYVVPLTLTNSDVILSIGIGKDFSFENEVSHLVSHVYMFDHTIENPLIKKKYRVNNNLTFFPFGIGDKHTNKKLISMKDIFNRVNGNELKVTFLKMDCEGAELEALYDLITQNSENLLNLNYILFEYHYLSNIKNDEFWDKTYTIFLYLMQNFELVYFHPNNFAGYTEFEGINFPVMAEFLFISKKIAMDLFSESKSNWRANLQLNRNNFLSKEIDFL